MNCQICHNKTRNLLGFKNQPISNRYLKNPKDREETYNLTVVQCESCGLIQLKNPISPYELLPRYPWLIYNEPEKHLNNLATDIESLYKLKKSSLIFGLSYKDNSLLKRLKKRGFENIHTMDTTTDLNIKNRYSIPDILEKLSTRDNIERLKKKYNPDVIIARHILEHCSNPIDFLNKLKDLIGTEGYIILEVPDCQKAFDSLNYTALWEEHICYFTQFTFREALEVNGFEILNFYSYPYPLENSLIAVIKTGSATEKGDLKEEIERGVRFSSKFSQVKKCIRSIVYDLSRKGKIAIFGAGHTACVFINFFELKDFIKFVIDDHENKKDLYMPGSHLRIFSSENLLSKDIRYCILALNPTVEDKIVSRNKEFINNGGKFISLHGIMGK